MKLIGLTIFAAAANAGKYNTKMSRIGLMGHKLWPMVYVLGWVRII